MAKAWQCTPNIKLHSNKHQNKLWTKDWTCWTATSQHVLACPTPSNNPGTQQQTGEQDWCFCFLNPQTAPNQPAELQQLHTSNMSTCKSVIHWQKKIMSNSGNLPTRAMRAMSPTFLTKRQCQIHVNQSNISIMQSRATSATDWQHSATDSSWSEGKANRSKAQSNTHQPCCPTEK